MPGLRQPRSRVLLSTQDRTVVRIGALADGCDGDQLIDGFSHLRCRFIEVMGTATRAGAELHALCPGHVDAVASGSRRGGRHCRVSSGWRHRIPSEAIVVANPQMPSDIIATAVRVDPWCDTQLVRIALACADRHGSWSQVAAPPAIQAQKSAATRH